MEKKGGMVAVVQGLQDSSLTVTLLDGVKQYTLMPNDHVPQPKPVQQGHSYMHCASQYDTDKCLRSNMANNREHGVQVTDGTYASTYKMRHCNLNPTSPQQTVTEFPPQRAETVHGHGNFVVGGYGSGETAHPAIRTESFRGGMVWPDKGSVCASRASAQSDAFANSLRKYPNITPERSSEIVQRLISFTQAKNFSKIQHRCPCSPTRNSMDSDCSRQTFIIERNSSKGSVLSKTMYQPEVNVTNRKNKPINSYKKSSSLRVMEQYDCEVYQRRMREKEGKRSVNMEIQAGVQMESKEMLTLPRIVPMQRTIATPLSPIPSKVEGKWEEEIKSAFSSSIELIHESSCKSIQVKLPLDAHINITPSPFDLCKNKYINQSKKRSRSEEELDNENTSKPNNILGLQTNYRNSFEINEIFSNCPISKNKLIYQNPQHLCHDSDILRKSVSSNMYFRDDFNMKHQRTSKDFIERSSHSYSNENNCISKDNYQTHMHQQIKLNPEYLPYIESRDKNITHDADSQDISKLPKACNESSVDWNGPDHINKKDSCFTIDDMSKSEKDCDKVVKSDKNFRMTPEEIRNLIELDIFAFIEKYQISITTESLYNLIEQLLDLFVMDLNDTSVKNKELMSKKIESILQNKGLSESHTTYLTTILTEHWEEEFSVTYNIRLNLSNFKSETLVVLSSIIQESSDGKQGEKKINDNNDCCHKEISQKDKDIDVEVYMSQISNEVKKWLSSLPVPEAKNEKIRQSIINDLATDIVDRQKYLELNSPSGISETSELEHLKYQIFKIIYKFDITNMTLVECATDLMKRFQSIPVPIFSRIRDLETSVCAEKTSKVEPGQSFYRLNVSTPPYLGASSSRYVDSVNVCCKRPTCKRNLNKKGMPEYTAGKNMTLREQKYNILTTSTRRMSSPDKINSTDVNDNEDGETSTPETDEVNMACRQCESYKHDIPSNRSSPFSGGIKIKDDEDDNLTSAQIKSLGGSEIDKAKYNQYLKEWVEKIPLPTINAEDQSRAEIIRTDIYNGVLEAVSKLRLERDTFNNRFLFEDKLDEEIEKLFKDLPQSSELSSKKHILKVSLIEKTSITNDVMKSDARSYKQELVDNLKGNLPKSTLSENENPDLLEIYEELQILNLVEDFIICSRYENENPILAKAYRNKLLKCTKDFVQELKTNHNKALKNIDTDLYLKDILDTLKRVSVPSNETIQKEADEILLSIEIDKWFSDLPLIQNNNYVEQLHRRRLKNNLAKQILEIEKGTIKNNSTMNNNLKHEISQFLGKAPLQQGESLNINIMVDELIKKLENRPMLNGNDNKKVAFDESNYEDFSRNLPLCSTYTGGPCQNNENQIDKLSSNKSITKIDQNHNISKPLFEDLQADQSCRNDFSLKEIPNYESFDKARPRSSSIKDDTDPRWYTLQESRPGYQHSNIPYDNTSNQNKSIQTISPTEKLHSRNHNNIEKSFQDDQKLDSSCCINELSDGSTTNKARPKPLSNGGSESNWYTLQESKQDNLQSSNHGFVPHSVNASRRINDQERFYQSDRQNIPEREYGLPQQYLQENYSNHYAVQQRRHITHESVGNNEIVDNSKTSILKEKVENTRKNVDNTIQRTGSYSQSPADSSPKSHETPRFNERSHPAECENILERQRSSTAPVNRSDIFYRSTDSNGIKRTIERNRSLEANINKNSEHIAECYQPSILIPPCYVPLRFGCRNGGHMDRNVDERYQELTEDENDEEGEVRCHCAENMWKNKRIRYCPFGQYDGIPMCVTSPYFYPYFY